MGAAVHTLACYEPAIFYALRFDNIWKIKITAKKNLHGYLYAFV